MSIKTQVGFFSMPTGVAGTTLAITGVGFQPKIVFFMMQGLTASVDGTSNTADCHLGFGVAISTSDRRLYAQFCKDNTNPTQTASGHRADGCIGVIANNTPTWDGWMDLSSFDSDGFTIKVGQQLTSGNAYKVFYLAIGGTELTGIKSGTFTKNTAAGNQSVTGAGFVPDALIVFGGHPLLVNALPDIQKGGVFGLGFGTSMGTTQQALVAGSNIDNTSPSVCRRVGDLGILGAEWGTTLSTLVQVFTLKSMDADGFTVNFPSTGLGIVYDYIALKGGVYSVVETTVTTDTTTSQNAGGFIPVGGLNICAQQTSDSTALASSELLSVGAFDSGLDQMSVCAAAVNNQVASSVVLGIAYASFVNLVKPSNSFEQRTKVSQIDPSGFFSFINQTAPLGTNISWTLLFGAEWNEAGSFTLA
jgi:hypothetical protein